MRSRRSRRYRRKNNSIIDNIYEWWCSLFRKRRRRKIIFQETYIELVYPEDNEEIFVNRPQKEADDVIDGDAIFMGEYRDIEIAESDTTKRI